MSTTAYPLQWPSGWKRTTYPKDSAFKANFGAARDELIKQLKLMGASGVVLSTNVPLRNDGLPYANYSNIKDAGVAVYFTYKKKQMVFACDRWRKVEDNLHAINKTIDAIRGIERWGASEMLERAFTGFAQLEAPSKEEWWDVLQCRRDSSMDVIKAQFRRLAKDHHPDSGGTSAMMAKINHAYDEACKEKQFN